MMIAPAQSVPANVVLFIPGYKGSALREKSSGRRVWVTAREELFGKRSLALAAEKPDLPVLELVPDGILNNVSVLPKIWEIDIYGGWLSPLRRAKFPETGVISFAYDWRQDNEISVGQLAAFIAELRRRGAKRIIAVAHSMGGLVLSYYLRCGAAPIDSAHEDWSGARALDAAVLIGTPFRGCAYVFRNMQAGSINRSNQELLKQFAISTFPAAYQLLTLPGQKLLVDAQGNSLDALVYDAHGWQENRWGLFAGGTAGDTSFDGGRIRFLQRQLDRSRRFLEKISAPLQGPAPVHLPLLLIRGTGFPTFNRAVRLGPGIENLIIDEDKLHSTPGVAVPSLFDPGDGVVTDLSSELPPSLASSFAVETSRVRAIHDVLGKDAAAQTALQAFIRRQLNRGG